MNEADLQATFPQPIVAVITHDGQKANIAPINFQVVSTKYETPLTVVLGISHTSYSLTTLLETKEFVTSFPSQHQIDDIIRCGTQSGKHIDKQKQTALTFLPATKVKPPLLDRAVLNIECRLVHSYEAGDFTIVVGEILQLHHTDDETLQKIYSLGQSNYGIIEQTRTLKQGRE